MKLGYEWATAYLQIRSLAWVDFWVVVPQEPVDFSKDKRSILRRKIGPLRFRFGAISHYFRHHFLKRTGQTQQK